MKKIFLIVMLGFLGLGLVGCGEAQQNASNSLEAIKQKGVITIGVFSDKPPFGFINKEGGNDGFDVQVSRQIAKDLLGDSSKVKFELVEAASRV
ncbi:transporter substrate-binding domain-containing protein, partial [Helicobacter canadensis]